jgi:regulatory protein
MEDPTYRKTFAYAVKILARKPRSVAELSARLREKSGVTPTVIDRVIARLQELGYLNDQSFAEHYITSKLSVKPMGRSRLRRAMVNKQLDKETIDHVLQETFSSESEEALCERALHKHLRIHGQPNDLKQQRKLLNYLMRLGFPYEMVRKKMRTIGEITTELIAD